MLAGGKHTFTKVARRKAGRRDCCGEKFRFCISSGEYVCRTAQSLSQKSKIFDSSLYTREPFGRSRSSTSILS